MSERRSGFLRSAGWDQARMTPLAGDASARKYLRLYRNGQSAILMETDPGEELERFIEITAFLRTADLSAPEILAADPASGLLLLEDLGDALFARLLERFPDQEIQIYQEAIRTLAHLHRKKTPDHLIGYGPEKMAAMTDLYFDWFATGIPFALRTRIMETLKMLLTRHAAQCDVAILRDFHAENLIWLPDRTGIRRVGLLDYQDAMIGHPIYDVVSLLQDARRDLLPGAEASLMIWASDETGWRTDTFEEAYHLLGIQRNMRILGIFQRLAQQAGKTQYRALIPRVQRHLRRSLSHPVAAPLAKLTQDYFNDDD